MNEHKSRKVNEKRRWVSDSVNALQEDREIEVLRSIAVGDIPLRAEYGIWFVLAEKKPDEELVKKVLQYIDSCSDPLMVCACQDDLIILPPSSDEKGMDGLNDAFAAYLKEIGWPGLLAGASGCSALSDVYRAYRMAHENWRAARAIYPERPWLRESEVRYGGLIRALAENKRIVRDAEENLQHLEKLYPNGEPLKFLSCYFLDCGMDLNMAAGKMFLHKNTLKYRRQKINELLGYPIEDVEKSYALVNMLALIRYEEVRQT